MRLSQLYDTDSRSAISEKLEFPTLQIINFTIRITSTTRLAFLSACQVHADDV